MAEPRTTEDRISDAKSKLAKGGDAWLATAGERGPHLVPLSLAWDAVQEQIIFCTEGKNRTSRNIEAQQAVQVAMGGTRDVLMIHGSAVVLGDVNQFDDVAARFSSQVGWDPRGDTGNWVFIRVTPSKMLAWREVNEIRGRVIMKAGNWLSTSTPS